MQNYITELTIIINISQASLPSTICTTPIIGRSQPYGPLSDILSINNCRCKMVVKIKRQKHLASTSLRKLYIR